MKKLFLIFLFNLVVAITATITVFAQETETGAQREQAIYSLIAKYAQARQTKDPIMVESVFATEVDQLTSSGEWRRGKANAIEGVMRSSATSPGSRTITVESVRFVGSESAIADARYEIKSDDGSVRKMWSTFIVIYEDTAWKISAIRNMLPDN
jgi:uncharacterized protein (TIGR02246 family)